MKQEIFPSMGQQIVHSVWTLCSETGLKASHKQHSAISCHIRVPGVIFTFAYKLEGPGLESWFNFSLWSLSTGLCSLFPSYDKNTHQPDKRKTFSNKSEDIFRK